MHEPPAAPRPRRAALTAARLPLCLVLTGLAGPAGGKRFLVRSGGPAARTFSGARNIPGLPGGLVTAQQIVSVLPGRRLAATRRALALARHNQHRKHARPRSRAVATRGALVGSDFAIEKRRSRPERARCGSANPLWRRLEISREARFDGIDQANAAGWPEMRVFMSS